MDRDIYKKELAEFIDQVRAMGDPYSSDERDTTIQLTVRYLIELKIKVEELEAQVVKLQKEPN